MESSYNPVYTDNLYEVLKKIDGFRKAPNESIAILSDFDKTITYPNITSLMEILRTHEELWESKEKAQKYFEEAWSLKHKYHPYEIDPHMELDKKIKYMDEWWNKAYELMIKYGFTKDMLYKALDIGIENEKIILRGGIEDFTEILYKENIPLIILSSQGLGGLSIRYILEKKGLLYENIHVLSNEIIFDSNGRMIGYKKPPITSANKHKIDINRYGDIKEVLYGRENIIVIGNNIEDNAMSEIIPYKNKLSFGFPVKDDLIEEYKKYFDILLSPNGDFTSINYILKYILEK